MGYLITTPISWDRVADLNRRASHDGCGAVVTFIGVVRKDMEGRRAVEALFYDAYPEMAEPLIRRLVNEANARWSLGGVAVQHRLGLVAIGHISVAVVVTAQHRPQAYAASQFLIERIKHDVPIWKREHYDDGTSQWMTDAPGLSDVAPACPDVCGAGSGSSGADQIRATSPRAMVSERSESCFDVAQHDSEQAKRVQGSDHAHV